MCGEGGGVECGVCVEFGDVLSSTSVRVIRWCGEDMGGLDVRFGAVEDAVAGGYDLLLAGGAVRESAQEPKVEAFGQSHQN